MLNDSAPILLNCILWGNLAPLGKEISIRQGSSLSVLFSDVEGGALGADVDAGSTLDWDSGNNINTDPFFATGPLGDYYLSDTTSGWPDPLERVQFVS